MNNLFDVIVVGGGHAGIEATAIAAKMGAKVLLITIDEHKISVMPCNPSIGGLGKGHIVYEVAALGGLMPQLCSQTYLQARMLNTKKGPAVQGLRLQIDKYAYTKLARKKVCEIKNLTIHENAVTDILWQESGERKTMRGVRCKDGKEFLAPAVIITAGTYLNGVVHIGMTNRPGGKDDTPPATELTQSLETALEVKFARLKTGTPPRLLRESIDFTKLEHQKPHELYYLFEFKHAAKRTQERKPCFIAYTNEKTHEIIAKNAHKSALFGGNITGKGPRYCPSIEDKVARFPDKNKHHIFIEPEGGDDTEVYPSGLSTSLPLEVQQAYINSIVGLENAIISKPGYAIEYDFLQPNNLTHTLETKKVIGLYCAGQVNGTTGYEEAAGQGIIAGINAALQVRGDLPFILKRTESYIGVMIDDLIAIGIDEPYRMFTSRAERRLSLRQDNVFLRLMPYAKKLGTIDEKTYKAFEKEKENIEISIAKIKQSKKSHGPLFQAFDNLDFTSHLLQVGIEHYENLLDVQDLSHRALLCIHASTRYDGYIAKEEKEVAKVERYQKLHIPATLSFKDLPGLSCELQEKLEQYKPSTLAQAQLIPGMTPAALSLLLFQIRKK